MYGKGYLEWKDADDAWHELHGAIKAKLSCLEPDVRDRVLSHLRAEYALSNVDASLLGALRANRSPYANAPIDRPRGAIGWSPLSVLGVSD